MTKFEKRRLKKLTKKICIQGNHKYRIIGFLEILIKAAREEFTEDNKKTLDCFLMECFKLALRDKGDY